MANVPPAGPRRRKQGRLAKMTRQQKQKRLEQRQRRKGTESDWRVRVWARRHIKEG